MSNPYSEGRQAYRFGVPADANPYEGKYADRWEAGRKAAEEEEARELYRNAA